MPIVGLITSVSCSIARYNDGKKRQIYIYIYIYIFNLLLYEPFLHCCYYYCYTLTLLPGSLAACQNRDGLTDPAPLIHSPAKKIIWPHGVYSVLLLSALEYTEQGGDKAFDVFEVTPPVDSTGGVTQVVFGCRVLTGSSFKSVHFWSFSEMVLCRLWVLGIAASIGWASFGGLVNLLEPELFFF